MKTYLYWCKQCGRYRTTDGDYVHLLTHERVIMILHIEDIELVEKLCPDCAEWRKR